MRVIITSKAAKKIFAIFEFWNHHNQSNSYSEKLWKQIIKELERLEKFPEIGQNTSSNKHRYLVLDRFKIFYRISRETVYIVNIFDTKEKLPNQFKG